MRHVYSQWILLLLTSSQPRYTCTTSGSSDHHHLLENLFSFICSSPNPLSDYILATRMVANKLIQRIRKYYHLMQVMAGVVAHCVAMVIYSCMAFPMWCRQETEEVLRDLVFDVVCPCTLIVVPSTICPYVTINCMQ